MTQGLLRTRFFAVALLAVLSVLAVQAARSQAALPVGYDVQKVDSPTPTVGGDFGIGMVGAGDLNADGEQDILVGTDEHGGSTGTIFDLSGEDGSTIRAISAPDLDPANPAGNTLPSFGSYVGKIADIGSCAGGTNGQTCALPLIGPADGVPDQLVTAIGIDVNFNDPANANAPTTLVDAGRAYVIDGATGAVLKRLQMPVGDLSDQKNAVGGAKKPGFGRTILNPSSAYGLANAAASPAVQIGDMNGAGAPDIVVGASDYFETNATANPQSACALAGPGTQCLQAGRAYVFYGEQVANSNPATIEDTPDLTIKNPDAQPDDLTTPVNSNRESFGYSIEPVGDLGGCSINPGPGAFCVNASSTGTPDGRPDVVISSHRSDDFGMVDAGQAPLIDGFTGALLYNYRHPEPQPASLFAFSNYNQPAPGDLGQSTANDIYQAAMRQNNPNTGGGKGYVMNGAFKQGGSPNSISFATLVDPTPHPSEDFGTSSAGIGNVAGDSRNELLVGAYGPHNPGTNPDVINDVHIMDPIHEVALQSLEAPDQQNGLGFGTSLAPLGDLNDDGFLDYAVGAGLYDLTASSGPCASTGCADAGRIYIFRSNNTPTATPTPPAAVVLTGRRVELDANPGVVKKKKKFTLIGRLDQFSDGTQCTSNQTVKLQQRAPDSASYTTVGEVTTGTDGTFSRKVKATKSRVYRAVIAETTSCGGDISSLAKVTVEKRKKKHKK